VLLNHALWQEQFGGRSEIVGESVMLDGKQAVVRQFRYPDHLAIDASGNTYVVDSGNHRVQKFASDGMYLTQWGTNGSSNGQFWSPAGVAVDAGGNVYVADRGNHRVQKFSDTGAYLAQWGSPGAGDGQLKSPRGIAVDGSRNVYVVDGDDIAGGYHHRIQKFSATGAFITRWGGYGHGNGQFSNPEGIAVDAGGSVYVTDVYNWRIQKFTNAGTYVTQWDAVPEKDGWASAPAGIAVGTDGHVIVAVWNIGRIQEFATSSAGR
jgi:DNA-binding beta-propeller fold protein YncE